MCKKSKKSMASFVQSIASDYGFSVESIDRNSIVVSCGDYDTTIECGKKQSQTKGIDKEYLLTPVSGDTCKYSLKKIWVMLIATLAIVLTVALVDQFFNTFISDILPIIVIVLAIVFIAELVAVTKFIRREKKTISQKERRQ